MTAHFFEKSVYGKIMTYPSQNCHIAQAICRLIGQKTIDLDAHFDTIKQLGIEISLQKLPS